VETTRSRRGRCVCTATALQACHGDLERRTASHQSPTIGTIRIATAIDRASTRPTCSCTTGSFPGITAKTTGCDPELRQLHGGDEEQMERCSDLPASCGRPSRVVHDDADSQTQLLGFHRQGTVWAARLSAARAGLGRRPLRARKPLPTARRVDSQATHVVVRGPARIKPLEGRAAASSGRVVPDRKQLGHRAGWRWAGKDGDRRSTRRKKRLRARRRRRRHPSALLRRIEPGRSSGAGSSAPNGRAPSISATAAKRVLSAAPSLIGPAVGRPERSERAIRLRKLLHPGAIPAY